MRFCFQLILLWLCFLSSADAQELLRVAVLEFRGVNVDPEILLKLSDQSRLSAVSALPKEQYSVMTRENMMMILNDMGKDASCLEGSCEVELGRNMGADYVVTGNILSIDNEYLLTLKLHETMSGKLLAGEEIRRTRVLDLVDQTRETSLQLYEAGFSLEEASQIAKSRSISPLYWVGTGLLVGSGTSAGLAYKTRNDFLNTADDSEAARLESTNRVLGIAFPVLLGLSATSYTLGWVSSRKSEE